MPESPSASRHHSSPILLLTILPAAAEERQGILFFRGVKGQAWAAEILTRALYQRASTAEVDHRAKPRIPAAVEQAGRSILDFPR
jgi:hypothetical protein